MLTEADIATLSRTRLPLPSRDSSPWPDTPGRTGRHYGPSDKAHLPANRPIAAKVVGLTFVPTYPHNLDQVETEGMSGLGWANLVREPDNPYDPNSVRVDWITVDTGEAQEIGHLPAGMAARLAPDLDAGYEWLVTSCEVLRVGGAFQDRPGCSVTIQRTQQT